MPDQKAGSTIFRSRRMLTYLALAAIAAVLYLPTFRFPLVYDDLPVIERNPVVTSAGGWVRVFTQPWWPPTESIDPLYRPLTTFTLKLNHSIFGPGAASFRAVNIILHALVTVLVAALAGRLWRTHSPLTNHPSLSPDWVAGILFAVHPIHAEALGLVVGRAELLATLFVCWILLRHVSLPAEETLHSIRTPHSALRTSLLFLAALCSKEHAVIAWPMVLLIDWRAGPHSAGRAAWRDYANRKLASHHLGMIVALAAFFFARWLIFGGRTTLPADLVNEYANPLRGAALSTQAAAACALLWLLLRQWLAAEPLCPIWSVGGFNLPSGLVSGEIIAGALAAIGIATLLLGGRRRQRRLWLVTAMFALSILLPCHFIPSANWLYAERWAYLPSVFLAMAGAGLAAWPAHARFQISNLKSTWHARIAVIGSTTVAAMLAPIAWDYQGSWRDQETVFRATVQRQPYNYHGNIGLLSYLERTGRTAEAGPCVERLIERFPGSERAWYYALVYAVAVEDWAGAETALRRWSELSSSLDAPPSKVHEIAD